MLGQPIEGRASETHRAGSGPSGFRMFGNPLHRVTHELRGRRHIQLLTEAVSISLDGLGAQRHDFGDFLDAFSTADQLEHFEFTIREELDRIFVGSVPANNALHEPVVQRFADVVSALHNLANRLDNSG